MKYRFERVDFFDTLLDGNAARSKIEDFRTALPTLAVPLKNRLISGFSLTRCFSAARVSGKTKNAA